MADQFEIELGLTEEGAGRGATRPGALGGAQAVGLSKGERRAGRFIGNRLFEDPMKGVTRYAIGEGLTQGFTHLTGMADQNAATEVAKIGADVGMRSIFLHSLRGGIVIGGLTAAISLIQRSVETISQRAEQLRKEVEQFKTEQKEINARINTLLRQEVSLSKEELAELRQRDFNRTIAPY